MQKIVLLGKNISHSRSPSFLNPIFMREGLPWHYELMPVEPEELPEAVERMKRGGYRGANVTSPYKEAVVPLMDDLSPEAERIGAVNTIRFEEGRATGANTDIVGFADSLAGEPLFSADFTAAVLGTGGAARAAVDVLLRTPGLTRLYLLSRTPGKGELELTRWGDDRAHGGLLTDDFTADLIVHATPVGLPGRPGLPIPPDRLTGCRLLYEMIYGPDDTDLMREARSRGVRVKDGGEMFERQALAALEVWRGRGGPLPTSD